MASNSGRRYGSSGGSRKRRPAYITGREQDRALSELRDDAARELDRASQRGSRGKPSKRGRPTPRRAARPDVSGETRAASAARRAADAKRDERETRRAAVARASRLRILGVAAAAIVVIAGCWALYSSSLFAVRRVEVEGTRNLTPQRVRELAQVPDDATLLRFPAGAVSSRVASEPWVQSVTVSRLFPDGMRIRVVERVPVAMADAGTTFWLVDATGMVIGERSVDQTATYVVIRDVPLLRPRPGHRTDSKVLMNAIRALTGLSTEITSQVQSISAPTVDGTTLYTGEKVEIVVGQATQLKKKSELILTILREQRGRVVSIDVRTTDRPTWRGLPQ